MVEQYVFKIRSIHDGHAQRTAEGDQRAISLGAARVLQFASERIMVTHAIGLRDGVVHHQEFLYLGGIGYVCRLVGLDLERTHIPASETKGAKGHQEDASHLHILI